MICYSVSSIQEGAQKTIKSLLSCGGQRKSLMNGNAAKSVPYSKVRLERERLNLPLVHVWMLVVC